MPLMARYSTAWSRFHHFSTGHVASRNLAFIETLHPHLLQAVFDETNSTHCWHTSRRVLMVVSSDILNPDPATFSDVDMNDVNFEFFILFFPDKYCLNKPQCSGRPTHLGVPARFDRVNHFISF